MKTAVITSAKLLDAYAQKLIDGVPADRATEQPGNLRNHPLWIVAHNTHAMNLGIQLLTGKSQEPAEWKALFGVQSTPSSDASIYPAWDEVVAAYRNTLKTLIAALEAADDATLDADMPIERLRARWPKVGQAVAFMLSSHPAIHWGQLSAWRRAIGLGPAM